MQSIFIDDTAEIKVDIFIANGDEDKIYVDLDKEEMLKAYEDIVEEDIENHFVIFRALNYGSKMTIASEAAQISGDEVSGLHLNYDVFKARYNAMIRQMKSWSFKGADGENVEVNEANIRKLHPLIGEVIFMGFQRLFGDII